MIKTATEPAINRRKIPNKPTSWKVGILPRHGITNVYIHNELRFDTRENAESYALFLKIRWHAISETMVFDSYAAPNTTYPVPSDRYTISRGTNNERIADRRNQAANPSNS